MLPRKRTLKKKKQQQLRNPVPTSCKKNISISIHISSYLTLKVCTHISIKNVFEKITPALVFLQHYNRFWHGIVQNDFTFLIKTIMGNERNLNVYIQNEQSPKETVTAYMSNLHLHLLGINKSSQIKTEKWVCWVQYTTQIFYNSAKNNIQFSTCNKCKKKKKRIIFDAI